MKNLYLTFIGITLVVYSSFGQWQPAESPKSIDIFDFHIDASGSVIATSYANGIRKLNPNESTWELVSNTELVERITGNDEFLFAAQYRVGLSQASVLRSTDNGTTWVDLNFDSENSNDIYDIHAFGNELFFSSQQALSYSTDNGFTWDHIYDTTLYEFKEFDGSLYGSGSQGVYQWDGEHWNLIISIGTTYSFDVTADEVYAARFDKIVKATKESDVWTTSDFSSLSVDDIEYKGGQWFFSGDGGVFITDQDTLTSYNSGLGSDFINVMEVFNDSLIIGTSSGPFISGGETTDTWKYLGGGLPLTQVEKVTEVSGVLYAATYHGIFKSEDMGSSWQPMSRGLTTYRYVNPPREGIFTYDLIRYQDNLVAGTDDGLFQYDEANDLWIKLYDGEVTSLLVSNNFLFIIDYLEGIYRYDGISVINASIGLRSPFFYFDLMEVDSGVFVSGDGIFFSDNFGQEWKEVADDEDFFLSMSSAGDDGLLLAGFNNVYLFQGGALSVSDDAGEEVVFGYDGVYLSDGANTNVRISDDLVTWYDFNHGLDEETLDITSFYIHGDYAYITTGSVNYRADYEGNGLLKRPLSEMVVNTMPSISGTFSSLEAIDVFWDAGNSESLILNIDSEMITVTGDGYQDTNVTPGNSYTYSLSSGTSDELKPAEVPEVIVYLPTAISLNGATNITESSFLLSWTGDAQYTDYVVSVYSDESFSEVLSEYDSVVTSDSSLEILGLNERTSHSVSIQGYTTQGRSGEYLITNYATTNESTEEEEENDPLMLDDELTLSIYPNPSSDGSIFIHGELQWTELAIFNLSGGKAAVDKIIISRGRSEIKHHLSPGAYILKAVDKEGVAFSTTFMVK